MGVGRGVPQNHHSPATRNHSALSRNHQLASRRLACKLMQFRAMRDFLDHLRLAFWRAFQHDAFAVAKGAAYSAILTLFPTLLVVASTMASAGHPAVFREFIP